MPNIPTSSPHENIPPAGKAKKLLDQYSETLRNRHYSLLTEKTYVAWVRQYILHHPREMGVTEINDFITHLVNQRKVAASTQNQAISVILFLYRYVLNIPLDEKALIPIRPTRPKRVPTILSREEARQVIARMHGVHKLMTQILYGSGLRLMEVLRLRVSMFPSVLLEPLHLHLKQVKAQPDMDLSQG